MLSFLERGIVHEWQLTMERLHFGCSIVEPTASLGCINAYYYELVTTSGASIALRDAKEHYATSPRLQGYCHQVTHAIGRAAAEQPALMSTLFSEGDPLCWSGYYHGVVEGKMRGMTIASITPVFVNQFCQDIPKTEANYFHYFNCVHGTGHAFMYISKNALPTALDHCAQFQEKDDMQNCAAGVFMENINAIEDDHSTSFIRREDPLFPCNDLAESTFRGTCYGTQATYVWHHAKKNPLIAFATCANIEEVGYHSACIEGIGREIVTGSMYNPVRTHTHCSLTSTPQDFDSCIVGAVKNFVAYDHNDEKATILCQLLEDSQRASCEGVLSAYMKQFKKSESGV